MGVRKNDLSSSTVVHHAMREKKQATTSGRSALGNPQKAKGDRYEVDLAHYFNDEVFKEEQCQRAPLSGGGRIGTHAGG